LGGRGFGYGGLGYGGFGYGGFGYGFGSGLGFGLMSSMMFGMGGYGMGGYGGYGGGGYGGGGYGGGGYGGGYGGNGGYNSYGAGNDPYTSLGAGSNDPNAYAGLTPPATAGALDAATQNATSSTTPAAAGSSGFAEQGEAAFKAGDYKGAVYGWKHAVIDDPKNPVLMMLLGQALFATGRFEEAAGATQMAMHAIPKEKWGVVVGNSKELYGNVQDYTTQLRALEKSVGEKPNDPALRFLAGFHYAYLGYPQLAVDQLDKGLKIAPQDEMAKLLRDEMRAKLPKPTAPATPAPTLPVPSESVPSE
jgi:hypothetical protein